MLDRTKRRIRTGVTMTVLALTALVLCAGLAAAQSIIQTNYDFTSDAAGYQGYQGALSWVAGDASSSGGKAKVTYSSGSFYALNSAQTTAEARPLRAEVRVRAANAGTAGEQVILKLREKTPGGSVVRDISSAATLLPPYGAGEWATLTIEDVSAPVAGNKLDVRLSAYGPEAGDAFEADWLYAAYTDEGGGTGPCSSVVPPAPTNLTASPFTGKILVEWAARPASECVDEYQVYVDGAFGMDFEPVPASQTSYTFFGEPGTTHSFRVSAHNADGYGPWSPSVSATVGGGTQPPANVAPVASFSVSPSSILRGQQVTFTSTSNDSDGTIVSSQWDLDNDGAFDDAAGSPVVHIFPQAGSFPVRLRVTDDDGATGTWSNTILVEDLEEPPPAGQGSFGRPFPQSAVYRPATGVAFDPNSSALVSAAIGAARNANSGRGPNIFGAGVTEKRYKATASDPTWTFNPGGVSAKAPACFNGSGTPDDTYGIYDEANRRVVRGWGGDSVPLSINCTTKVLSGSTIGVADLDGNGIPYIGNGTAWGLMSGLGPILGDDWANRQIDHRIKVALGTNLLADNQFRAPAIAQEHKATGTAVPMGTTYCHVWTPAQIDAAQAGLSGDALAFSDMFWTATACDGGYGLVIGDGTGTNGFMVYAGNPAELPLSGSGVLQPAIRLPGMWANSGWRALVAG